MKKTLRLLLTMLVLFTVSACGGQPQTDTSEPPPEPVVTQPVEPSVPPRPAETEKPSQEHRVLIA